ncbi:MAG: CorA family divalent cation transporter [Clostridia bacterium]
MKKVLYAAHLHEMAEYMEAEVFEYLRDGQIETFESFAHFDVIAFDWYDVWNPDEETPSQIMIYFDREDLFFICEEKRAYEKVQSLMKACGSNERALYEFFLTLIKGDLRFIEQMEDKITSIEDALLVTMQQNVAAEIMGIRSEVLRLKKYYEQLDSIFEEMVNNDNDLFSKDSMRMFANLQHRINRLLKGVLTLRDYATQVREAYQAQIDIAQNNLMKVFTVITSIFLPLTLIVGWYGMNFNIPEFGWRYGYSMVIVLSCVICAACVVLFKKKKWF